MGVENSFEQMISRTSQLNVSVATGHARPLRQTHQPSLGVLGPYIIDTLLLFQCFEKNDHHGSKTLSSVVVPFRFRQKPAAAIFRRGLSACWASGRERKPVGDLPSAEQRWSPDNGGGGGGRKEPSPLT